MKVRSSVVFLIGCALFCLPLSATNCEGLANLSLPHTAITTARSLPPGTFVQDGTPPIPNLPAFCRVAATLTPTADSNIRIEVWMPDGGWNGKYQGTGNGGYAGAISYGSLAGALRGGYAVANTDMGTASSAVPNGDGLIGHPERWADWGWRATHEMTVAAKEIIRAYYGREPERSYFYGCSTGGEQAMMEAQRFPDDYDGIVAGAAANNRTRLHMEIFWAYAAGARSPADHIPADKLPLITDAVLNACPKAKAAATDTFLTSPEDCRWDPAPLLCKAGDAPSCLTAEQVATVRSLYSGPRNPATHDSIYPGVPRGSEFGWTDAMLQAPRPPYDSLFKWVFGPDWNWRSFDFNQDVAAVDARLAPMVNATSPDLSTFKAHGHKLIAYHGTADWLVPPQGSIDYYKDVLEAQAAPAASHNQSREQETQTFFRLFLVPGMAHCSGGPGLNTGDFSQPLELWVEKGIRPVEIPARRIEQDTIVITRPLCPYPQTVRNNGTGGGKDTASFSCADPGRIGGN
jgi:feruloyl esterase